MKTYPASKAAAKGWTAGTREWVFELLGSSRYRERADLISGLELRRRPDCEPCLRALVLDEWTPETQHHLGWCDSCRKASFALDMSAPVRASARGRRRAVWLALAAGVAIAASLVGSQVIDDPFGDQQVRGGGALTVPQAPSPAGPTVVPVPRAKPVETAPSVRHERSAVTERGQRALPLTT